MAGPCEIEGLEALRIRRAEAASLGIPPTIEEVRRALASIPGCMSQDIIAERGDY